MHTRTTAQVTFAALALFAAAACAQSGGGYDLTWNRPGGGGITFAAGGPYELGASTGQGVAGRLSGGDYTIDGGFWLPLGGGTVSASSGALPVAFAALVSGPNPFRDGTSIRFELPSAAHVDVTIFSLDGRRVRGLLGGARQAGRHTMHWDGLDADGRPAPSGVYFVRIAAPHARATLRLVRMF